MATNLALDDKLIEKVVELGKHRSKKDAVTAALKEYIEHREQIKIIDLFGQIEFDKSYDYKAQRERKRGSR